MFISYKLFYSVSSLCYFHCKKLVQRTIRFCYSIVFFLFNLCFFSLIHNLPHSIHQAYFLSLSRGAISVIAVPFLLFLIFHHYYFHKLFFRSQYFFTSSSFLSTYFLPHSILLPSFCSSFLLAFLSFISLPIL